MSVDLGTARGTIIIDTSNVATAMQKAGASMSKFQAGATVAMAGVAAATGALAAAMKVAEAAWKSFEHGADLSAAQGRFERLTASINSTSDAMLGRLREATNGMMSDAQLIASANDIMSLGLAKTEDQTVRLATVVGKLGWDMSQTILTFANNSKLRLDALGLSLTDVEARTKKLQAQGMSLDEAFDLAVIEAGEAKIALLGDASETTAGQIKQLRTVWENTRNAFDQAFAEGLADSMEDIAGSAQMLGPALEAASAGLGRFSSKWASSVIMTSPVFRDLLLLGLKEQAKALEEAEQQARAQSAEVERRQSAEAMRAARLAQQTAAEQVRAHAYYVDARRRGMEEVARYERLGAAQTLALTGKTVEELARMGLTATEYMRQTAEAAAARAEESAARYHAAFASVQDDYTTALANADKPLINPQQDVSIVTQVSGPTQEQAALAARYRDEIDRLQESYNDLTAGIGTYGMEQDALTKRIEETAGEIAYYQGLLDGIPPAVNRVSTEHQGLAVNMDAVNQAIYDQLAAMPGAENEAILFAEAVGIMSAAQAEAALKAAAVKVKIDELAAAIAGGMSIDTALVQLQKFTDFIENGVNPALGQAPAKITEFKDQMQEGGRQLGEVVPTGLDAGIRENLSTAETAAGDMATAVIDATRGAFGVESPSTVFAEIGGDLMAGLGEGMTAAEADMLAIAAAIGEETIAAWDDTIAAAPEIGADIIAGIIAGLEANREALIAEMTAIAQAAEQAARDELESASPSEVFARIGEDIIAGIVDGLDREKDTLYGKLAEIAGKLSAIGRKVFDLSIAPLEKEIDDATEALDGLGAQWETALGQLAPFASDALIGNLSDMTAAQQAEALRGLRGRSQFANNPEAMRRLNEAIRLADERVAQEQELARLEEEHLRRQEELARLEEQRARLDFLNTQVDLLNLIRDNNLDASILDGLELGLDANMEDIIAAMTEAVRQLVERTNDELEIASPSGVFEEIGANVMDGFADGIRKRTDDARRQLQTAMKQAAGIGLADSSRLDATLRRAAAQAFQVNMSGLNPAQTVNVYGGYNVALAGRATAEPLRELFYEGLQYQG